MSDIVERLRNNQQHAPMINHAGEIYGLEKSLDALAADEIERKDAAIAELVGVLKPLIALNDGTFPVSHPYPFGLANALNEARAAIAKHDK